MSTGRCEVLRATGAGARECYQDEPGVHRWTVDGARVRVTVELLYIPNEEELTIAESELDLRTFRPGCPVPGPGSAVTLRHKPSGLVVCCETERSALRNRAEALALLRAKLWASRYLHT